MVNIHLHRDILHHHKADVKSLRLHVNGYADLLFVIISQKNLLMPFTGQNLIH